MRVVGSNTTMSSAHTSVLIQWVLGLIVALTWAVGWSTGEETIVTLLVLIMNIFIVVHMDNE